MRPDSNKLLPPLIALFTVVCLSGALFVAQNLACSEPRTAFEQESRRDRELQPERLMDALGVKPGMVVAEPGCGDGYFTFKLARRVGGSGRVYAEDIDSRALRKLEERRDREGVGNIVTVLGEVTDPLLPERELDLVIFIHAFHDFEKPVEFLENLKPSLKQGATVVDVDIDPEKTGNRTHFDTGDTVKNFFHQAGYEFVRSEDFLDDYFVLIFRVKE